MLLGCWGISGQRWSDLASPTKGQREACGRQTGLLPSYAWGCPRTFEKHFLPCSASCEELRCYDLGRTDLSRLTFSHKPFSCGPSLGSVPLLRPWPLSPHLIFSSCSAKLFLFTKPLSCYLFYYHCSGGNLLDLTVLATRFQPYPFFPCGQRESREPHVRRRSHDFSRWIFLLNQELGIHNGHFSERFISSCCIKEEEPSLNRPISGPSAQHCH